MSRKTRLSAFFAALVMLLCVCSILIFQNANNGNGSAYAASLDEMVVIQPEMVPLGDTPSSILIPVASGTDVKKNSKAEVDVSNIKDGYFMVKYLETTTKTLKVLVKGPSGTQYQYALNANGKYEVFPLSDGNGSYQIGVYENVSGTKYSTAFTVTIDVKLSSEYAPFILPNQYVNYNKDSTAVKKAAELTKNSKTIMDKITVVYNFVVDNIKYDKELAANIKSGYIPDVDAVLKNKKGVCFDYAALMSSMLRSQGIPTKLVVGYAGDVYHAWISVYSKDEGWIDKAIYFDGKTWSLMDPTFVSTGGRSEETMKYVNNKANYTAKYIY